MARYLMTDDADYLLRVVTLRMQHVDVKGSTIGRFADPRRPFCSHVVNPRGQSYFSRKSRIKPMARATPSSSTSMCVTRRSR